MGDRWNLGLENFYLSEAMAETGNKELIADGK